MTDPTVTVVMPVYNTAQYVGAAIESVLQQTFTHFELLVIDDAGSDNSIEICQSFDDPRIRIIHQQNRGLAGARNTGIRISQGEFIAFLDSDDLWHPEKLARHVEHLRSRPEVGVSYAASDLIDDDDRPLRLAQCPKLKHVTSKDVFLRNPVGNGSAPVIRAAAFIDIMFRDEKCEEVCFFNESFRQSEDIECWLRIALTTSWKFEGIKGSYTTYRVNQSGLSANVIRQYDTWCKVRDRAFELDYSFASRWAATAEAFQLRYLARRCVCMGDGAMASNLMQQALQKDASILLREPVKSLSTIVAATALRVLPNGSAFPMKLMLKRS